MIAAPGGRESHSPGLQVSVQGGPTSLHGVPFSPQNSLPVCNARTAVFPTEIGQRFPYQFLVRELQHCGKNLPAPVPDLFTPKTAILSSQKSVMLSYPSLM